MVIIGDAVHATSPSSGQGASMAIEDAVVLAKCLRDIPDTAAAFASFKKLRRERVERVVKHGKRSGDGKAPGRIGAMHPRPHAADDHAENGGEQQPQLDVRLPHRLARPGGWREVNRR